MGADPERTTDELFTEEDYELETTRQLEAIRAERLARSTEELQRCLAERIALAAAGELGISAEQLRGASRGRVEVLARNLAIHCAQRRGLSEQAIARALCISQQRVSVVRRREPSDIERALATSVDHRLQAMTSDWMSK